MGAAILALLVLASVAAPQLGARPARERLRALIPSTQEIGVSFKHYMTMDAPTLEGLKQQCVQEGYPRCQEYDEMIQLFRRHNLVLHKYVHASGDVGGCLKGTYIDFHVVDDIDSYVLDLRDVLRLLIPGDAGLEEVRVVEVGGRKFLEVHTPPHPVEDGQSYREELALVFAANELLVSVSQSATDCGVDADFLRRLATLMWDNVNRSFGVVEIRPPAQGGLDAYFTMWPESPTDADEVTFTATELGASVEYRWYLDGRYLSSVGSARTWKCPKLEAGTHTVKLVVEDGEGNRGEYKRTFEVVEAPNWPCLFIYEQVLEGGRLTLRPLKVSFTVRQPGGRELAGITDEKGNTSMVSFLTDSCGRLVLGGYRIELDSLPTEGDEWRDRWGTYRRYPSRSRRGPIVVLDVQKGSGGLKCKIRVTRTYSVWVADERGRLVAVYPRLGPEGLEVGRDLVLVVRSLNTWEALLRAEIEGLLKAAGVSPARARGIVEKLAIRYGVDCGMCGSEPCPGEFKPPNIINIRLAADEFYSFGGITGNSLSDLIHEFGHRVKEELLHDPGARLGGSHVSEWDPSENRDTAYDEGFANFFPILVMSYSRLLPSYVGEHYDTGKYLGRHPGGARGDWIEGRITGFWTALYGLSYSGKSAKPAAVLRDFLRTCAAFRRVYGRYPRTMSEWIMAKAFLDPASIPRIEELAKPAAYDMPVLVTPDMREPAGILRSSGAGNLAALVLHDNLEINLTPPSRLSASHHAVAPLRRGGLSVLVLEPGDCFRAGGMGFDGTLFLRDATSPWGDMLRVDLYGLSLLNWDRGLVKLLPGRVLYVARDSRVHVEKLGEGVKGLKVRTDSAEITGMNSEFVLEVDSGGVTCLTVLQGEVVVAAASEEVVVEGGQMTRVEPGQPPHAPLEAGAVEAWWIRPAEQAASSGAFAEFREVVLEQSFAGKCLERGFEALVPSGVFEGPKVLLYPASLALKLAMALYGRVPDYDPELRAVLAISVASVVIGAAYLLAPTVLILALARRFGRRGGSTLSKGVLALCITSIAMLVAGEYLASPSLTTPSILLFATATALAAGLLPAVWLAGCGRPREAVATAQPPS